MNRELLAGVGTWLRRQGESLSGWFQEQGPLGARLRRRGPLLLYFAVLVWFVAAIGLPTDRIDQTIWILAGITAARIGRPLRDHMQALLDWMPLLAALLLYDYTRGIADTLGMPVRVAELVDFDSWLFGGTVPTVWLQEHLYTPGQTHWYDIVVGVVYMSHFVVPWVLAAAFYIWSRERWWKYIRMVLALSYAGLATYILIPAAPPWYAASTGVIGDTVVRNAAAGWWDSPLADWLGLQFAAVWFDRQTAGANDVAALPSLHAAFAMLIAVALWPVVRHWAPRLILALFPLAMGFTLVYGGEHYVLDVLLGWAYVLTIALGFRAWDRWSAQRMAARAAEVDELVLAESGASPDPVGSTR